METLQTLEIIQKEFPIYLSDYNNWMISLAVAKKNIRKEIGDFYRKMLSKIDGDCLVNNLFFYINGKPFTYENIIQFDIKDAIKKLDTIPSQSFVDNQIKIKLGTETYIPTSSTCSNSALDCVQKIAKEAEATEYPCFYYYQIPITEEQLIEPISINQEIYFRIKPCYLPYLRYFDLSKINLKRIDIRGIDLSNTNINSIDFASIYQNSLEETNLENVVLIEHELANISVKGANLCGTYLKININCADIKDALIDDSVTLYSDSKGIISSGLEQSKSKKMCSLHF